MNILNLDKINKNNVDSAGGKGASLGEMLQNGIPVPDGFVILSQAFEKFFVDAKIGDKIDEILHSVDQNESKSVEDISNKIKTLILNAQITENLTLDIKFFLKKLGAKFVAVRSSATAEDNASAAWAGQLETFLYTTEENLIENIKKCWASLFSPRAINYRFEKKLDKQKISVAVVVQKMIESEKSGTAFSVHPVTQNQNQIIIESGFGLGEAIVSGQVTPDSYIVEKKPLRIIDKNIQVQTKGLFRSEKGGIEWRDTSKIQRLMQVLSDKQIIELSELVLCVENHYKFPCDIEWAIENGYFFILQSRPITTVGQESDNFQEYRKIMNRSMFLMASEIWELGERTELPKICEGKIFFDPLFTYIPREGITVYYNFTDPKQYPVPVANYFNERETLLDSLKEKFDSDCSRIKILTAQKDPNKFGELFKSICGVWPLIALGELLGQDEFGDKFQVKSDLYKKYQLIRKESDGVLHWGDETLLEEARQIVPESYKEFVEFLLFDEIMSKNFPSFEELKKRQKGYIFHNGKLYAGETLGEYSRRNKYVIVEEKFDLNNNEIHGNTAFPGKVCGTVRIVLERRDIEKVKTGEILITSMTTPNLISAMNKAVAFVTDEGGITCHAAIIAREFKKPCVIGTKVATKFFENGDKIEVDADHGIIRLIS